MATKTSKKTSKKTATKNNAKKAAPQKAPGKSIGAKKSKGATPTQTKVSKPKRSSLVGAAVIVLAGAEFPMNAKAIVKQITDKGLWTSPGGKTPHATLYAAMTREIATKGSASRFKKIDRGLFTAA